MEEKSRVVELPVTAVEPGPAGQEPESEPTLADYLAVLSENRWLIAAAAAAALVLGALYLFVAPPKYRSDVLVQVEEKQKGFAGLDDLSGMFSEKTPADTEMEIIRSRSLIGTVVDQLGLDISVQPRRLRILGGAIARHWTGSGPAPAWLGLSSFAWGGEKVRVDRLDVGPGLLNDNLWLVARREGRYAILDPDDRELASGTVGKPVAAGEGPRRVGAFVSQLVARPGTRFYVKKVRRDAAVENLQRDLRISEKGKKTGVIVVALEGRDPERIVAILDAVAQSYVRQNVERKSAEAEKTLQFIESQLPVLKANVDRADEQLNSYRVTHGSVDLSLETKGALDRAVDLEKSLTELDLQQSELAQRFTASHPAIAALQQKREKLLAEKAGLEQKLKGLPAAELDSARLMRDAKVASELYFLLINKAQELRVVKSGTIGNVRVLDTAVLPYKPVSPKTAPTLALSLLLGLAVGVGAAFVRKSLDHSVDDPDVVERATGVGVYASVPHSARQDELVRQVQRERSRGRPVLAADDPADLAVEALRSLRTSLQFSLLENQSRIVAVVGAAPSAGKSFVCANLACVLAGAGKRVLVLDADLRRGRMHAYFGGDRAGGLSELVAGEITPEQAVRTTSVANVSYVSTGVLPANPSELLASERFRSVVSQLASRYDVLLLDTAPILAVADGIIAGRLAGVNLLVLRAGVHPVREIALAAKRFRQNGVRLHGVVMNDVTLSARSAGKYAYHYQYEYRREE